MVLLKFLLGFLPTTTPSAALCFGSGIEQTSHPLTQRILQIFGWGGPLSGTEETGSAMRGGWLVLFLCLGSWWVPAAGKMWGVPQGYRYSQSSLAATKRFQAPRKLPILSDGKNIMQGMSGGDMVNISVTLPIEQFTSNDADDISFSNAWWRIHRYADAHKKFYNDSVTWLVFGQIISTLGFILLIFSEVRMILAVRAQDSRRALEDARTGPPTSHSDERREREKAAADQRPYLSASGAIGMAVGSICFLTPVCSVLVLIGLPKEGVGAWPCWMIILLGALFYTFCVCFFTTGVLWSCTRPWAALVLLVVAILGNVLIASTNPLLIMLWIGTACSLLYWYFEWYPAWCEEIGKPLPDWCQGIGPVELQLDITHWGNSFRGAQREMILDAKGVLPEAAYQHLAGLMDMQRDGNGKAGDGEDLRTPKKD